MEIFSCFYTNLKIFFITRYSSSKTRYIRIFYSLSILFYLASYKDIFEKWE